MNNREILFRGKRVDNGKWVEGDLIYLRATEKYYICDRTVWFGTLNPCKYEVAPSTVGQYTDLTDKNGKKIFEGDIVEFPDYCNGGTCTGKIEYSDEDTAFQIEYDETDYCLLGYNFHGAELEILGNIHDNLELLKGEEE